ncbi:MAG: hypothetical protein B7Y12_19665 [Rhizobiales bacterium 24-66-13]|jgi:hypothetical protein|uniref:hypothetical protein n=1 Tax=Roseixanthobacter finlandensis TaxID=3119922 RepID=UPI000BCD0859|nr:MAG: hypothetical protein B7Z45_06185 [Azorhizobium sp. 12-66-6]OYZ69134.1 MAG: hypothetical protein B7Y12_19665 [Rhizobiales bacterium 24-66-13]HQS11015.1 hypothetical protein [Xanthobacteraceae bacterium]HQS47374.1 hypothetical protein [Xanthobacteraceae bacterium]
MRAPHRRDISARQDLLGKELRQLFDEFTQEDVPDDLLRLAQQLQGAVQARSDGDANTDATPAAPDAPKEKDEA